MVKESDEIIKKEKISLIQKTIFTSRDENIQGGQVLRFEFIL